MPQCLYGSEKQAEAPDWYEFQYTGLAGLIGPLANLATPELLGLPSAPFYVPDFCATEPTGTPFQMPADLILLGTGAVGIAAGAWSRLGNTVKYNTFADLCICKADTSAPDDCYEQTAFSNINNVTFTDLNRAYGVYFSVNRPMWFEGWSVYTHAGSGSSRQFRLGNFTTFTDMVTTVGTMPSGNTIYQVQCEPHQLLQPGVEYHAVYERLAGETVKNLLFPGMAGSQYGGALNVLGGAEWNPPSSPHSWITATAQIPVMPRLCDYVAPPYIPNPYPFVLPPEYPTGPATDCADGDSICAKIDTVNSRLSLVMQRIDLIQRQIVPFAYIPGTNHTGLSGFGSFAVQGILGLRVSLTTVPNRLGRVGNASPTLFDAGYVTVGTADGDMRSTAVMKESFVILDISPAVTSVSYDFTPGVVANIQELIREP